MIQQSVNNDRPKFQIIFIVSNEIDLLKVTLPVSLDSLTKNAKYSYEVVVQMDNATSDSVKKMIEWSEKVDFIDEIRIRNRKNRKLVCPGDLTNNPHFHIVSDKSDYIIAIECDVIAVLTDKNYDALSNILNFFNKHPKICLINSVIDYDCWVWKLQDIGSPIEKNIRSVNRISTHFLIYHTKRFLNFSAQEEIYDFSKYSNDCLYEDIISNGLLNAKIPIAFFNNWEIKVRHCDEKQYPGSLHYKRDPKLKLKIAKDTIDKYGYKAK